MLHFHYYDAALSREQYKEKLTGLLKKTYGKNNEEMYKLLEKRQGTVIKNARKLFLIQYEKPLAEQNPITTVYKLVERLIS